MSKSDDRVEKATVEWLRMTGTVDAVVAKARVTKVLAAAGLPELEAENARVLELYDRLLSRLQATKRVLLHALYEEGLRQFPGEIGHDAMLTETAVEWAVDAIHEAGKLKKAKSEKPDA